MARAKREKQTVIQLTMTFHGASPKLSAIRESLQTHLFNEWMANPEFASKDLTWEITKGKVTK